MNCELNDGSLGSRLALAGPRHGDLTRPAGKLPRLRLQRSVLADANLEVIRAKARIATLLELIGPTQG
jgi:hypothetical protein